MRLDRPSARTLMLVVGFVGLRKQGEIQRAQRTGVMPTYTLRLPRTGQLQVGIRGALRRESYT